MMNTIDWIHECATPRMTTNKEHVMYAIAGVTGNTGSVVADTLLAQGHPVRVLARAPAKATPWRDRGADVAIVELTDEAALTRALTGVDGAYLLLPPRLTSRDPIAENRALAAGIARAVRAARVPHVVLLSSIGAQHPDGTGPIQTVHAAERELAGTGAALTAVRAAYFIENWGAALGAVDQGILPTFLPVLDELPMVATRDIGRVAAGALVEGGRGRQVIELAGPRERSPADIATAIASITGVSVRAQQAPLAAVVPTFTGLGMSREVAALFRDMYAGIASGRVAWEGGAARAVRGSVTAEDVLRGLLGRA
jgi:uncharacterized protein YbjT (DUF2867 family)